VRSRDLRSSVFLLVEAEVSMSNEDIIAATSAACGGFISSVVLYPCEIIKNRYQAELKRKEEKETERKTIGEFKGNDVQEVTTFSSIVRSTLRTQGVWGFYKGVFQGSGQSALEKGLYNLLYQKLIRVFKRLNQGASPSWPLLLVLGYLCEWSHMPLTMPLDVGLKLYQIGQKEVPPKSYVRCVVDHYRNRGVRGFYAGGDAYFFLCCKPAIQYMVFETVKPWWLRHGAKELTALRAFFVGAFARAVATLLIYPFIRSNAVLKGMYVDNEDNKLGKKKNVPRSTLEVLVYMIREHGFFSLYQGLSPQISRGVMSAALAMLVKEKIAYFVRLLLIRQDRRV